MNNGIKTIFVFSLGAAIGSVVTWKLLKTKYEQIAQEEIDSVKETFSKTFNKSAENLNKKSDVEGLEDEMLEYTTLTKNYTSDSKKEEKGGSDSMDNYGPYVISPDEFGELEEYDTISLTYYADEVLADDQNEVIDDIDDIVGLDSLDHFGEYEDDSVFVRNDELKCDYEILLDTRRYSDLENPITANLTVEE